MICVNTSSDSNDSAISYSPPSLAASPIKSLAIKQLLESPIINHSPRGDHTTTTCMAIDTTSDSDVDVNDDSNDMTAVETPTNSPEGSQTGDLPEVTGSQTMSSDKPSDSEPPNPTPASGRNTLRRQPSVCLNTNITSSPRALAILKNAIKTSLTSHKVCDKSDISKTGNELSAANGTHSPPKSFRSSPLSRGSAALKAAKERLLERQESQRSPKISCSLFQMTNDTQIDKQLTSILRKRELQSSPTNGDHRAKKKKVLFAEPVVSSQLEFRPSPSSMSFRAFDYQSALDREVEELTSDKKRNNLVHQDSTFDKEFVDITYDFARTSPIIFTEDIIDEEPVVVPACAQSPASQESEPQQLLQSSQEVNPQEAREEKESSQEEFQCAQVVSREEPQFHEEEEYPSSQPRPHNMHEYSSKEEQQCSQVMPEDNDPSADSEPSVGCQTTASQTDDADDPVVNIPMRLSLVKQLYAVFGDIIRDYPSPTTES